jgi:hypothetical protein
MSSLPQELLSVALRVKWEHGHSADQRAVELIAKRLPAFSAEQHVEASQFAAALDGAAYDLAAAWFARRGTGPFPTVEELEARCPGFSWQDYADAVHNNLTWARK